MRKILSLSICFVLLNCGSQKQVVKTNKSAVENPVQALKQSVSIDQPKTVSLAKEEDIKTNLEYLSSDELEGRKTGTAGIEKAAIYIENYFKEQQIKPYFKTYRDSFNLKDIVGYNIVGYLEGNDPELKNEFVILGAHYDHIGTAKVFNGDTIANGANDDASGTVAVMEWAKYFSKTNSNKRSVLFTLYAAEEMGLKGSEHLAERLKKSNLNVYTMINFEMIGVPRTGEKTMSYITGYKKSNMAEKLNTYAGSKVVGFLPQAKAYNLFQRSDNYPFYKAFNMPAHAISTFDFTNFDYYHHADDEADKMDFKHMTNFINKMIPALESMVNASEKEIKVNDE